MSNPKQTQPGSTSGRFVFAVCLVLATAILAVFWQVRQFEFIDYDDGDYVAKNAMVQRGVTAEGMKWAFTQGHAANWHPLTWLTHMVDCEIYGNKPGGHHFTNVLFHVGNTLLLFLFLRTATGFVWRSALIAALFGLHPAHVESVAWVAERKDVLSTFFALLTLLAYHRYVQAIREGASSFKRVSHYMLSLALFACALMSKPMVVTLPFALLLLDVWPFRRIGLEAGNLRTAGKLVVEKVPFLILTIISCVVTFQVQLGKTVQSLSNFSILDRLSNVLVSYVLYVGKLFWPAKLAFFYPLIKAPPLWQAALALAALIVITTAGVKVFKRAPYALIGWFWFLGTLIPVIGLVHVGEQSHADRYTYIPSIGFFVALVWLLAEALCNRRVPKPAVPATATVVLLIFSVLTWKQVGYWRNNEVMLERALAVTGQNFLAHNNYGVALADKARLLEEQGHTAEAQQLVERAVDHYQQALAVKPTYARAYNNLGSALTIQGKLDAAVEAFQKSLEMRPDAQTHHNLALALARQKKYQETIFHCREALRLDAGYHAAYFDLALALSFSGKTQESIAPFESALQADPGDSVAHYQLGLNLLKLNQPQNALVHLKEAARLKPDWVDALNRIAWIQATHEDRTIRNAAEAIRYAEAADRLTGHRNVQTLTALAAAYAENREFDRAGQTMRNAVDLAQAEGRADLAESLKKQLGAYESAAAARN